MKPGIYYDLPYDAYAAIDAVRWSELRLLGESALKYQHGRKHEREDTTALRLGRLTHTAVLEPERIETDYAVYFGAVFRGKEYDAFVDEHPGKTIVHVVEMAEALAMARSLRNYPPARKVLCSGHAEVTIVWRDTATGILCKGRVDWLRPRALVASDVKTTQTIDARRFGIQAHDLLYEAQLAFYQGGLFELGMDCQFKVLAVEKKPPFEPAVFALGGDQLYAGEVVVSLLMAELAKCQTTRRWGPRYACEQPLDLPSWAYPNEDEDTESTWRTVE
ncbi:MAG: PD-(D/E)XK nuclease-like domain-containing protein [Terriglobia bacterium]|jgi:hypothetical protein